MGQENPRLTESLKRNYAFIDGQNLHMNTAKKRRNPWKIDLVRFRLYLKKRHNVSKAYYFFGYPQESNEEIYKEIERTGFILVFRAHNSGMLGLKKGNVDADIIFHVLWKLYKRENFHKVVLVSGDGDFKLLVDALIEENKFEKILFPSSTNRSSLYKSLTNKYCTSLDKIQKRVP